MPSGFSPVIACGVLQTRSDQRKSCRSVACSAAQSLDSFSRRCGERDALDERLRAWTSTDGAGHPPKAGALRSSAIRLGSFLVAIDAEAQCGRWSVRHHDPAAAPSSATATRPSQCRVRGGATLSGDVLDAVCTADGDAAPSAPPGTRAPEVLHRIAASGILIQNAVTSRAGRSRCPGGSAHPLCDTTHQSARLRFQAVVGGRPAAERPVAIDFVPEMGIAVMSSYRRVAITARQWRAWA